MEDLYQFERIKNDVNGNPRYVCHFLALLTREELDRSGEQWIDVGTKYNLALHRARKIGGRKFHNKKYGGGIVFQCYGPADIVPAIEKLKAEAAK
jgi:hypothetical protein